MHGQIVPIPTHTNHPLHINLHLQAQQLRKAHISTHTLQQPKQDPVDHRNNPLPVAWLSSLLKRIPRPTLAPIRKVWSYHPIRSGKRGDDKDLRPGTGYYKKQMRGEWHWYLRATIPLGLKMDLRIAVLHR